MEIEQLIKEQARMLCRKSLERSMTNAQEIGAVVLLQDSPNFRMLFFLIVDGQNLYSRFVAIHPFDHGGITLLAEYE
jgi:hypothetical protein